MTPEELASLIARMSLDRETEGGMTSEDAVSTLDNLIDSARRVTGINPGYPTVYCPQCGADDIDDCDCGEWGNL